MKLKILALAFILSVQGQLAFAENNLNNIGNLIQSEFKLFSKDLAAALSYKSVAPPEPLGITGFDLGIELTATDLNNSSLFDKASTSNFASSLIIPKIHLHKGLPWGLDVAASLVSIPDSNIELFGAELRYAIIEGSTLVPAVSIRGSMSKLSGVSELDLDTTGLDLSISKGFAILTPYAGVGRIWTTSSPAASTGLTKEEFSDAYSFVGLNINLGVINLAFEGDRVGKTDSLSAKLGWRF